MKLSVLLLLAFPLEAWGTAYTSSQNGPWSSASTWGGAGPPGIGDTATVAHTVTVDVDTAVGTSPNDTTTAAININGSKSLVVGTNITLAVKGNLNYAGSSASITLSKGAHFTFDPSASGGSPIYRFIGGNVYTFNCNGIAGTPCYLSATNGFTFTFNAVAYASPTWTYCNVTRATNAGSGSILYSFSGSGSVSHCTFDGCDQIDLKASDSASYTISDCIFTNATRSGTLSAAKLDNPVLTAGTRIFTRNVIDKDLAYSSKGWTITSNYIGSGIAGTVNFTWTQCRNNVLGINGANGAVTGGNTERNYIIGTNLVGNPHYVQPFAQASANTTISQNIFEGQDPDLIDEGDCLEITSGAATGGFAIIARNNIVLPSGYVGNKVASGTLLTLYSTVTTNTQFFHNTANGDSGTTANAPLGVFDIAEAGNGAADQVSAMKSNLGWASAVTNNNYLLQRQQGDVKDIVTPTLADYNWRFNLRDGDNQRGYDDRAANNTLWTAGDAVAAGVDAHQGSGDPRFYDPARNMAKWCYDRGYGTQTYTNAVTVIQNDLTKIPDLINYVFEGYRPANPALRSAAHDGGCVGAANWYQPRNTNVVANYRAGLSAFGL